MALECFGTFAHGSKTSKHSTCLGFSTAATMDWIVPYLVRCQGPKGKNGFPSRVWFSKSHALVRVYVCVELGGTYCIHIFVSSCHMPYGNLFMRFMEDILHRLKSLKPQEVQYSEGTPLCRRVEPWCSALVHIRIYWGHIQGPC